MLLLPPEGGNLAVQDLESTTTRPQSRWSSALANRNTCRPSRSRSSPRISATVTARHCGRFHVTTGTTAGVSVIEPTGQQAITESVFEANRLPCKRRLPDIRGWRSVCRGTAPVSGCPSLLRGAQPQLTL